MTKVKTSESSGSASPSSDKGSSNIDTDKPPPMVHKTSSSKSGTGKKGVRCNVCKKKLGIACRYQCRCGLTFCSVHRYPETHECSFDYKTEGRNKIREENPVIVAPKIQNI